MSQRQRRSTGRLSADRTQRLDALGVEWAPPAALWDKIFARLGQFKDRFGHCHVLRRWPEDPQLGIWVMRQRIRKRKGRLSADRIQRLDALGFEWDPRATAWEEMFARLGQFQERFGHCHVRSSWPEDPQLGIWVHSQRQRRSKGHLSADHIRRLEALGFEWAAPMPRIASSRWDGMFARLVQFKDRFGHCHVRSRWPEDPQLAKWVYSQRQRRGKGRLSADRIQRLDALGFEWEAGSGPGRLAR